MNSLHELLVKRRSIRRYKEQPLNPEDVKLILEAGLMSPTSKNSRAWQFVAVDEPEMLQRLSQCKPAGAHPIAKAALAVVVAVDATKSDAWIEDASASAAFMQLQATDLGIGSCWIEVRDRYQVDGTPANEYVQELLGIPEEVSVVCILTFGYPDEERRPCDTSKLHWENVHIGSYKAND